MNNQFNYPNQQPQPNPGYPVNGFGGYNNAFNGGFNNQNNTGYNVDNRRYSQPPPPMNPQPTGRPGLYPQQTGNYGVAPIAYNRPPQQPQQQPQQQPPPLSKTPSLLKSGDNKTVDVQQLFSQLTQSTQGVITNEVQLQEGLSRFDATTPFSPQTARIFFRACDANGDRSIEYREFRNLWRTLLQWKELYQKFDMDHSGNISFGEYQTALREFGFSQLSDRFVNHYFLQHATQPQHSQPPCLNFDGFVQSLQKLNTLRKAYSEQFTFNANMEQFENMTIVVHKLI